MLLTITPVAAITGQIHVKPAIRPGEPSDSRSILLRSIARALLRGDIRNLARRRHPHSSIEAERLLRLLHAAEVDRSPGGCPRANCGRRAVAAPAQALPVLGAGLYQQAEHSGGPD